MHFHFREVSLWGFRDRQQSKERKLGDNPASTWGASAIGKDRKTTSCEVNKKSLELTVDDLKKGGNSMKMAIRAIKDIPIDKGDEALAVAAQIYLCCKREKAEMNSFALLHEIRCVQFAAICGILTALSGPPTVPAIFGCSSVICYFLKCSYQFRLLSKKHHQTTELMERFITENNVKSESLDILKKIELDKMMCCDTGRYETHSFLEQYFFPTYCFTGNYKYYLTPKVTKETREHLEKAFVGNADLSGKLSKILADTSSYDHLPRDYTTEDGCLAKPAWKSILSLCIKRQDVTQITHSDLDDVDGKLLKMKQGSTQSQATLD